VSHWVEVLTPITAGAVLALAGIVARALLRWGRCEEQLAQLRGQQQRTELKLEDLGRLEEQVIRVREDQRELLGKLLELLGRR
jgi:hypothetical protein